MKSYTKAGLNDYRGWQMHVNQSFDKNAPTDEFTMGETVQVIIETQDAYENPHSGVTSYIDVHYWIRGEIRHVLHTTLYYLQRVGQARILDLFNREEWSLTLIGCLPGTEELSYEKELTIIAPWGEAFKLGLNKVGTIEPARCLWSCGCVLMDEYIEAQRASKERFIEPHIRWDLGPVNNPGSERFYWKLGQKAGYKDGLRDARL